MLIETDSNDLWRLYIYFRESQFFVQILMAGDVGN